MNAGEYPIDGQHLVSEVDILPLEAKNLTLTHACCEREQECHVESVALNLVMV